MFNISNLVQKAQSAAQQLIDPMQGLNLTNSDRNPAKSTLFQHQFRLPSSQTPLYEIPAELTIPPSNVTQGDKERDRGWHYAGKLHLSEAYMCFSTTPSSFVSSASTATSSAFTGQTHGGGPSGNGFTFPLCAIRRVERLNSQSFQVSSILGDWRHLVTPSVSSMTDLSDYLSLRLPLRHGTASHKTRPRTRMHRKTRARYESRESPSSSPERDMHAKGSAMV